MMKQSEIRPFKDVVGILATALMGGIASLVSFMFFTHLQLIQDVAVIKKQVEMLNKEQEVQTQEIKELRNQGMQKEPR